jgi:exopolyphosphatase/guanosine-5'-triphosphate,3'-diphosphate pyrophosphatase
MKKKPDRLAAIDVGTNSFHLVVVEVDHAGQEFKVLDREKEIVRLGSGSSDMKRISRRAMARGLTALKRFKALAVARGALLRAVATSAVREAANREEFRARAKREVGVAIEIISGVEEARLIYQGILKALSVFGKRILLVDIGGGSTEFLLGQKDAIRFDNSLKLGAIRLTERFFPSPKIRPRAVEECRRYIRGMLNPVIRELKRQDWDLVVGTSGTVENIAQMVRVLRGEDRNGGLNNFRFTRNELARVAKRVVQARTPRQRDKIKGLDPDRTDIITAGVLILEQLFTELDLGRMTVSEYALREGLVIDTIHQRYKRKWVFEDLRHKNVLSLAQRFNSDETHAQHTALLALRLFDQTRSLHGLGEAERDFLEIAALLHDVGFHISHAQHHMHSYYLIRNAELLGFTEDEKEIIANLARYHRKSHPKPKHETFQRLDAHGQKVVRTLAGLLRIADGLDRSHTKAVRDVVCRITPLRVKLALRPAPGADLTLDIWGAQRKKALLEELFGRTVVLKAVA